LYFGIPVVALFQGVEPGTRDGDQGADAGSQLLQREAQAHRSPETCDFMMLSTVSDFVSVLQETRPRRAHRRASRYGGAEATAAEGGRAGRAPSRR